MTGPALPTPDPERLEALDRDALLAALHERVAAAWRSSQGSSKRRGCEVACDDEEDIDSARDAVEPHVVDRNHQLGNGPQPLDAVEVLLFNALTCGVFSVLSGAGFWHCLSVWEGLVCHA